ncbi:MAG: hypothetical protein LRY54_03460 [Alphaproteobacteria bacterium]|nr:hypothetical protein [Alphaproteobacteria bacterium]
MLVNELEVFKEQHPRMSRHAGQEKIFFHYLCTGDAKAYGIDSVNKIFEDDVNTDNLQPRLISLMVDLQACHQRHGGNFPEWMLKYNGAEKEYPGLYERLLHGLSDKALDVIARYSKPYTGDSPFSTGAVFVRKLKADRLKPEQDFIPTMGPEPGF